MEEAQYAIRKDMMSDPLIGRQLANFRVERVIGRGGMAQVYYGCDVKLERPVAIKVIDARYRNNPAYAQRFVQEARALATWRHENIIQIYYADDEDGLYYYVMEYVDGLDLDALLAQYADQGELMPIEDVLRIGRAVADALDYAHRKGVIHRDIKPSNVMVASDGRVLLTDFGLAMDVQQGSIGEVFGSPHYVAPEQARRSADAVPQSDLYSLGVILYEMLSGVVPFDDPSPAALAIQHITMPPPSPRDANPALSEESEAVLMKALSKEPAERYQTGRALMDALERTVRTLPPDPAGRFDLPLPPAAVQMPAVGAAPRRPLSHVTVAEKIALHLEGKATQATSPPATAVAAPASASQPQRLYWFLGSILLLALLVILAVAWANNEGALAAGQGTPTQTPRPTAEPSTIATDALPVAILPTATASPSPTFTPTAMPSPTPTQTQTPSPTPSPEPTSTLPPTPSLPLNVPTLTPTVRYPDGHLVRFFYNDLSFYLWNTSGETIQVAPLAFEALDGEGEPTIYRFDGRRWAAFYGSLEPDHCNRIEAHEGRLLRPAPCDNVSRVTINLTISPTELHEQVFWVSRDGGSQFRILWNEEEIGRCPVDTRICDVYLPPEE